MKKYYPLIIALLGVVIGSMLTMTVSAVRERKAHSVSSANWRKLDLVLEYVDGNYVDTIKYSDVTEAALQSALSKLDPHSVYMPPVELEEAETDLSGQFEGIGIQFNVPNDTAIVLEVIPGGPSEKIGLQPGDRILKVDTTAIAGVGFPQDSMVRRMKGPAGTKVLITVGRGKDVIPFEITRGKIPTHSVDAAFMVADSVGYVRVSKFSRTTFAEFVKAGIGLSKEGMREMIVDLRGNSGGFFDQALNMSNLFLEKGDKIVYLEGRKRPREEYTADGKGIFRDIDLKVLIDDGSASSSEIFAGAMQDNDRGVVFGRRSFGKGLVQEPLYFSDGSGVRITVARLYTPSGRCIQKPYADDYAYDILKRYRDGEMVEADSIRIDKSHEYLTKGGRVVYGGGGIVPDVFVPIDTTKVSDFYINCNRKATAMRFASAWFDKHKTELQAIEDYPSLLAYLDSANLETHFLSFARRVDSLVPKASQWKTERDYMMTSVRALVGRYSKLGDNAFYHLYLSVDNVFKKAMEYSTGQ